MESLGVLRWYKTMWSMFFEMQKERSRVSTTTNRTLELMKQKNKIKYQNGSERKLNQLRSCRMISVKRWGLGRQVRSQEYLWLSWRRGERAAQYQAERGCGFASAGLWTSRAGRHPPGWGEPVRSVGKGLRQWADAEVWSSLPSAAPWFYWSRLGYPADSQETTFVTREQPSVQSVSI